MKYMGTLIAVTDLEKSRQFYRDVLGLKITTDYGPNVTFNGCIVLQTLDTWVDFIKSDYVMFDNRASELYFETNNFDEIVLRLNTSGIEFVHKPIMHRWGQRVVRFYDPDKHIIEIGEAISMVVKRFAAEGMNAEQIAERMEMTVEFVRRCLNEN